MNKKFIDNNIYIDNLNILLRVDYNVPIINSVIQNDNRITNTFETINLLFSKNINNLIIISHLGRPKGKIVDSLSLKPIYNYLKKKYNNMVVKFTTLDLAKDIIDNSNKSIILIENIRFHPEEEMIDSSKEEICQFQKKIHNLADVYINDAFGTCHRKHSSIIANGYEIKLGGLLIKKELINISKVLNNPKRPFVCILGGAKVNDKIKLIYNLLDLVDDIIIGGGMAFTFMKMLYTMPIGNSLFDIEGSGEINKIMKKANEKNVNIHLPIDFLCGDSFNNKCNICYSDIKIGVPNGYMGLDIGMKSSIKFSKIIKKSKTILWNGPMGVFEFDKFSLGSKLITNDIYKATECYDTGNAIIGGGDTASCFYRFSARNPNIHISTGGGATLKLLEGGELPGITTLNIT
jgi:phosphoglycerate kinase